jgi:hypothetical protein
MSTAEAIKHPAAGGPPGKPQGGPPAGALDGMTSGFEGREELLGKNIALVLKTIGNAAPYQHEMNDALVKALLTMLQFAKNLGKLDELVAHDAATMRPLLERVKGIIEKTGNRELALVALCERTACHYQLVLETKEEPGRRTFKAPYRVVLEASRRLGQFDLTEEEVHNQWTIPRYTTHAAMMGVNVKVSPWSPNGIITLELVD